MKPHWKKEKPNEPGEYLTRHAGTSGETTRVIVTKRGGGFSVYCPAYHDRVAMSEIGTNELEWCKVEAAL